MAYFVNQKLHKTNDTWTNNVHVKEAETDEAAFNLAMHQFHAFMSTYGYGQDATVDYCSGSVEAMDGRIVKSELDDRLNV